MYSENEINEMTSEELTIYVTKLLAGSNVEYFNYEVIKEKSKTVTNTHFRTNDGWEINKEDKWND